MAFWIILHQTQSSHTREKEGHVKIAVASRKGGVGKSSITSGLAGLFAQDGYNVLAVDLDPQSNLAFILGADPTAPGTSALLAGEDPEPLEVDDHLYVFPGGPELGRQDIARLDPEDLLDALSHWEGFDVILFDCPPGSQHLERLGIVASTKALVVTNAHPMAIVGAGRVIEDLETRHKKKRKGPTEWAIVANMIDARRSLDKRIEEMLEDLDESIPRFRVRQDIKVSMASAQGVPLISYAPDCNAMQDLEKIQSWCLEGEENG